MFKTAVKQEAKLRLAIAGPSGSGKTYTALAVASHLGKKIALVDTEHGSASKYADIFRFDVMEMLPPFHPKRFGEAIAEAQGGDYDVIILDSLSHAWNGTGGLLELVDQFAQRYKGNTFAGWKEGTPIYNHLIDVIVQSDIHVIATMRSKQDYVLDVDSDGKQRPKKVGMAPIQRDGFEYEFDVFLEMDIDNIGRIIKTRCPNLTGKAYKKPNGEMSSVLVEWLKGAPKQKKEIKKEQPKDEKINRTDVALLSEIIVQNIAENIHEATNMMLKCNWEFATQEKFLKWAAVYRGWRDSGLSADDAAEKTNNGEKP